MPLTKMSTSELVRLYKDKGDTLTRQMLLAVLTLLNGADEEDAQTETSEQRLQARAEMKAAVERNRARVHALDLPELSMDDINAEIEACHREQVVQC
jgi:hypothetical protein